jgi:hypothetical protein
MFILTINGRESEGAYSVIDDEGEKILYLFEDEDDAIRHAMLLEQNEYPEMHVIEVDDNYIIKVCESYGHMYTIITPNDIVIPPEIRNDYI